MPSLNAAGLQLIESFEGCELTAYQDAGGVWTIGFGHTGDVHAGQVITRARAVALLDQDVRGAMDCVASSNAVNLTPNQFAALVSFTFNVGCAAFRGSSLLRMCNAGDFAGAADQFGLWIHVNDVVSEGLVRRRAAERALFVKP